MVQGWGRIGCRVVCMPPHEICVIVILMSLEIVFILLKEHYPDLIIHPRIGCIGMVSSSESLQTI